VKRTDLARDEGSAELVESFAFAHHASHLACSLSHLMLKMWKSIVDSKMTLSVVIHIA
jgi:hypothetical protein